VTSFRRLLAIAFGALCLSLLVVDRAEADIVFLTSGRTLSVKSYEVSGGAITLSLRAGGTLSLARDLIDHIGPDEVAYPEPAGEPIAQATPAPAGLESKPYAELISTVAASHGMDVKLVHAVVEVESNYQPRARSKKGAQGLMQLMPATARQYDVKDPYDPKANLDAGVRYLKDLLSRLDLRLALAAYNAGEAVVQRYGGMPPFAETRNYVQRVLQRVGP
jgi:soluble lytic murein transglycosylase-like protein